jgi:hypothetical protein
MSNEKEARALLDYLLKHKYLVISRVAAGGSVKAAGQIEKAEKRFLTAFLVNTVASVLIILSRVWGVTTRAAVFGLRPGDFIILGLAAASLVSLTAAWLEYFSIGISLSLSVERALEIKPKE